jgi:hypothetical protein
MRSTALSREFLSGPSMERRNMLKRTSTLAFGGITTAGVGGAGLLWPGVASAAYERIEANLVPHIIRPTNSHVTTVPWTRGSRSGNHYLATWDVVGPTGRNLGRVTKLSTGNGTQIHWTRAGYNTNGSAWIKIYRNVTAASVSGRLYVDFHDVIAQHSYDRMAYPYEDRHLNTSPLVYDIDNDNRPHVSIEQLASPGTPPIGYTKISDLYYKPKGVRLVKAQANSSSVADQLRLCGMAFFEHNNQTDKRRWRRTTWLGNSTSSAKYQELASLWTDVETKRNAFILGTSIEVAFVVVSGIFAIWAMGPTLAAAAPAAVAALEAEGAVAAGAVASGSAAPSGLTVTAATAMGLAASSVGSIMGSLTNIQASSDFSNALQKYRNFIEANQGATGEA